jgi:hypothetical protein
MIGLSLRDPAFLGGLSAGGGALWTPAQITTAMWLDAQDAATITTISGAVSQWNDKSGNARHVTQSTASQRPAYSATGLNGLPALQFDGSDDFLGSSYSLDVPFVIAAVWQNSGTAQNVRAAVGSANQRPALGILNASPAVDSVALWTPNVDRGAYINNTVSTSAQVVYSGAPSTSRLSWGIAVNGSSTGQVNESIGSMSATLGTVKIGWSGNASEYWNGLVSEVLIAPSATQSIVEGYLAWKWGLAANLPAGHPYKSAAPTI